MKIFFSGLKNRTSKSQKWINCKPSNCNHVFIMTSDHFETLAQMIKGLHDDFSAELAEFQTETRENFQRVFAHLQSHDSDLRMIKTEMMDMGKKLRGLAGLEVELIETKRRVTRLEKRLDIPTVGFK